MAYFLVDADSLTQLAGSLATVKGDVEAIQQIAPVAGAMIGGPTLTSALTDFAKQWSYGIQQLETNLGGAVTNVQQAAQNYTKTDVCVADSASAPSS